MLQIDKETYLLLIDHHSKFIEIEAETGISGISAEISCITSQKRRQDVATAGSNDSRLPVLSAHASKFNTTV